MAKNYYYIDDATAQGPNTLLAIANESAKFGIGATTSIDGTGALISGIITASQFVGDGSDLRNLSGTHIVSYASHSETSNSALSIAGISTYNQVGILTGSPAVDAFDNFGGSVATSADGKTIIVGAFSDEIGENTSTGVVYVYDRVGSSFNQVGILTGSLAVDASDQFGTSVATSADGKTIIVGAFFDEIGDTTNTGVVYVFDRVGNSFNQVGILTGSLAVDDSDNFGNSVATSADGKTIIVGASADEQTGSGGGSGVTYVFDRVGSSFNQVGILTGSLAGDALDRFGNSVATSADGKTIIVGANFDEIGSTSDTGVVYVYDRVGNSFNQVGILTGSLAGDTNDRFGTSVATGADGKTIIVGALQDKIGTNTSTGVVYVYDRVGNSFNQVGILTGSLAGDTNDLFGNSVATSADGKTIIVGASADEQTGSGGASGVAYVFNRQGNSFNQVGIITGSLAGDTNDLFGNSVATSADGKTIVVGARADEIGSTSDTGVVYVFDQTRDTYVHSGPTGSIGIGTANPTSKLHVVGDTKITGKILNNSGNTILNQTGSILQVVHTELTTSFQGTSLQTGTGFYVDVTGLSATITPTSSSNKILILTNMYIGKTTTDSYQQHFRIKRNGTAIILGAGEGGRPTSTGRINMYSSDTTSGQYQMVSFNGVHYDSPASTSALTYQIELGGYSGSLNVYVNKSQTWQVAANDYDSTPVSTLTLMEVSA